MEKRVKVLMVAGSMNVGGIENQLMHLLRNADKEQFQFDFTSDDPEAFYKDEIEALGGRCILIPKMNWKNPLPYCKKMFSIIKDGKYDVVHSHELFHSGITLFIAYIAGVPCRFVHAHNWRDDDGTERRRSVFRLAYNVIMRILINRFSTVEIACSTWAGNFLYGKSNVNKGKIHIVFNSVDTRKFLDSYNQVETGEYCEKNGWKNIINVARISKVKNQMFLVDIAEELRKRQDKLRILCVGRGDAEDVELVQKKIESKGLGEYIQLLGVRKDIDSLMRKSSVFVLPSKYEGMPLAMIEAQASGLPCVSADTYSTEVDFEIGTVVWLPLNSGVQIWTDTLEVVAKNGRAPKSVVEKAIQKKNFDSKMFAKMLCELYEEDYLRRSSK